MFSGQLPQYLDPRKAADQGGTIRGRTTVGKLPRLREFEQSLDEPVEVALQFEQDEEGHRLIRGTIDTRLVMTCQRCLEPVTYDIHADVLLALVWGEDQLKALPERLDPWLVTEEKIPVAALVEEELLLALPLVAMHEQCPEPLVNKAAPAPDDEEPPRRDNPFAVLADLKKGGADPEDSD